MKRYEYVPREPIAKRSESKLIFSRYARGIVAQRSGSVACKYFMRVLPLASAADVRVTRAVFFTCRTTSRVV